VSNELCRCSEVRAESSSCVVSCVSNEQCPHQFTYLSQQRVVLMIELRNEASAWQVVPLFYHLVRSSPVDCTNVLSIEYSRQQLSIPTIHTSQRPLLPNISLIVVYCLPACLPGWLCKKIPGSRRASCCRRHPRPGADSPVRRTHNHLPPPLSISQQSTTFQANEHFHEHIVQT